MQNTNKDVILSMDNESQMDNRQHNGNDVYDEKSDTALYMMLEDAKGDEEEDEDNEEGEEESSADWGDVDPLDDPQAPPSPMDPSGPGSAV